MKRDGIERFFTNQNLRILLYMVLFLLVGNFIAFILRVSLSYQSDDSRKFKSEATVSSLLSIRRVIEKYPPNIDQLVLMDKFFHATETFNIPIFCRYGATVTEHEESKLEDAKLLKIWYNRPPIDDLYHCVCPFIKYNGPNCYSREEEKLIGTSLFVDDRRDLSLDRLGTVSKLKNSTEKLDFGVNPVIWSATPVAAATHVKLSQEQVKMEMLERYRLIRMKNSTSIISNVNQDLHLPTYTLHPQDYLPIDKKFYSLLVEEGPWMYNDMVILSHLLKFNQERLLDDNERDTPQRIPRSWIGGEDLRDSTKLLFIFIIDKKIKDESEWEVFELLVKNSYTKGHYYVISISKHVYQAVIDRILAIKRERIGDDEDNIVIIPELDSINADNDPKALSYMNILAVLHAYKKDWKDWSFTLNLATDHALTQTIDELEKHLRDFKQTDLFVNVKEFGRVSRDMFVQRFYEQPFKQRYPQGKMAIMTAAVGHPFSVVSNVFYRTLISSQIGVDTLVLTRWTENPSRMFLASLVATLTRTGRRALPLVDGTDIPRPLFDNQQGKAGLLYRGNWKENGSVQDLTSDDIPKVKKSSDTFFVRGVKQRKIAESLLSG